MATTSSHKLSIIEKSGYAMGDAAANLVWRGVLAYIAVFYTDTLGITAAAAATLLLLVRLSDGITDIIMGMIADRTNTKWGRFRPWILWSAPVLALFMVLAFTVPDVSPGMKLAWAYFTYIGLTLAYTVNNVPYSALMGVMTPSHQERTVLSSFRFAGAFLGGVLVMSFTPDLVAYFGQGDDAQGYQYTFYLYAALLIVLCCVTFFTTKERVTVPVHSQNASNNAELLKSVLFMCIPLMAMSYFFVTRTLVGGVIFAIVMAITVVVVKRFINKPIEEITPSQRDLIDMLKNLPWLMIIGLGLLTMFYNGIRGTTTAYYFARVVGDMTLTGTFFLYTLMASVVAALTTGFLAKFTGKKALFAVSLIVSAAASCGIYFTDPQNLTVIFAFGIIAEFFAAFMPVLIFSMLGDAADYSEWKNGRRATGLLFSAGTFIQKMGNGFAGALVLLVLAAFGYVGTEEVTSDGVKQGIIALMSWIPALFALSAASLLVFYPLNTKRMAEIEKDLMDRRGQASSL